MGAQKYAQVSKGIQETALWKEHQLAAERRSNASAVAKLGVLELLATWID